ncbi:MAG: GTPase HflX [Flavobacteriales bacterium]
MSKKEIVTAAKQDTAVLVGLSIDSQDDNKLKEYLDELEFLAETAGIVTVKKFSQRLDNPNPATFVGSGKLDEVNHFVREHDVDTVIFDDELTPSQLRNVEKVLERKVQDRTSLILDIFAQRARTAHAKAQVELARCQYMLPRLRRMWTHLERQRGGTGTRSGSGELQIESDRRMVLDRISKLKEELKQIDKQMATQRGNRGKLVRAALVGYTNVGKSTIMNLMSKSDVFAENKLFATLDTTVRKVVVGNIPFLLTDTVGFIRKLPHQLVESFKSTLDEVREADLLIHVLDISHPGFEDQYKVVNETLREIKATDKPTLILFNKIDAYRFIPKAEDDLSEEIFPQNISLEDLKKTWMARMEENPCVFISAFNKINIDEFRKALYDEVKKIHVQRFPYNDFLYQETEEN